MIAIFLLAQASASAPSPAGPSGLASMLIPFLCIGAIFYFLIIRPQSKRQKEQQALVSSLKTGDRIVTSGGIHGLISNVKDTTVMVKIADNVKIEIDKASVTTVAKRTDGAPVPATATS
jgi:preprotein translocase subunit YajC